MPRAKLIRTNLHPYHITNRYNNKATSPVPMKLAWKIYSKYLYAIYCIYNVRTHAFVLMHNHYHLLASTPDENLDQAMRYFHTSISKSINFASKQINHQFGGRYHWCLIENSTYLNNVLRYIYLNPVKAGWNNCAQNYPWSTLSGLLGNSPLYFPVYPLKEFDSEIPSNPITLTEFVSIEYPDELYEYTRQALNNKKFKVSNNSEKQRKKILNRLITLK